MNLADILMAFNHKISGGDTFCWNCFGPNAWFIDFDYDVSLIIDRFTREIYCVSWYPDEDEDEDGNLREITWVNPSYMEKYIEESKARDVPLPELRDDLDSFVKEISESVGFYDELKENQS
jgi:hypothetical protein